MGKIQRKKNVVIITHTEFVISLNTASGNIVGKKESYEGNESLKKQNLNKTRKEKKTSLAKLLIKYFV